MKDYYSKDSCRLCENSSMKVILPLKKSPLCDAYSRKKKKQNFYNLNLCLCSKCGFVQIDTIVDPSKIYRDYIYVTTSSSGLKSHFRDYAQEVCSLLDLFDSKLTVDIGSNDGTLLEFFKKQGHKVLGIEPSGKAAEISSNSGIFTIPEFFDQTLAQSIEKNYGRAELITINNLFANVDDLSGFVNGIDLLLAEEGVLIIESSYLLDMIENMVFDFIYHEHLSYFSIQPLQLFFKRLNMRLIRVEHIKTKGGSLRYFFSRENSKWDEDSSVKIMLEKEIQTIADKDIFVNFENRINLVGDQLVNFLKKYKGKKIVGYGASATSTTLISHFGLNKYLSYLVDDNPDKIDTYSPGFNIPVFGSEKIKEEKPDVIIILAWRYKDEIINKLSNNSSVIAIPLPEFNVVH